ncbi:MAG TPA: DUF416 family protein [Bacteroidales bacterium]|nr:DUF416 family protein [Bacteroidales bacterium]
MQVYLNFFDKIDKLIAGASVETKFNLALDVCKQLYPGFEAYVRNKNADHAAILIGAIEFCEQCFLSKKFDESQLNDLSAKIEAIIPDATDFSNWNISYASNAAQAVYELLAYVKDSDNRHISDICSLVIDTIDYKLAEENEHISDDGIYKHPLMLKTMEEIEKKLG